MNALMTERIRLIIDTEDVIRRAVHLRKIKMPTGTTVSDVVNGILRQALAEEIGQVEGYPKAEEGAAKAPRKGKKKPVSDG